MTTPPGPQHRPATTDAGSDGRRSSPARRDGPPRGVLLGLGVLLAGTLAVATAMPSGGGGGDANAPAERAVLERELRFDDRADGGVAVRDAATGAGIAVLEPGTGGFVRGTVRALVRDRKREAMEDISAAPFRLALYADGRLSLEDRATGRALDLRAFGATNAGAFAAMLPAAETRRSTP